ncbi:MAG: Rne/Rng family ribonuclease, partial [Hyphomicrobiaceae bacterium]
LEQESREQAAYDAELDDEEIATEPAPAPEQSDDSATAEAADAVTDADAATDENVSESAPSDAGHDFEAHAIDVTDLIPDATDPPDPEHTEAGAPSVALDAATSPADIRQSDEVIEPTTEADAEPPSAAPPHDASETPAEAVTHVHITAEPDDGSDDNDTDDEADDEADEDDVVESLNDDSDDDDGIEAIAGEDDADDDDGEEESTGTPARRTRPQRPRRRARHYKIQEVIKRRQIVLIQVVKEERGNKGAALTTYLSLAGRYTVLMPNTARGGGISRKITNVQDRKRLKAIAQELEVPEGMGLIIRTAGAARTKQEIKRDFEYLLRLWENVRSLTLESTAPSLVYEEGNLIKRSIRDLYTKEIDEVVVAGEHAHKEAKGFMRMLMPSHAKNVIKHEDSQSLFAKYRIEQQLNAMFSPNVQLKSGGYLVINQTEALVAIDVNSGKSTREFSIEETALNTNLEAAEELARQLKLRDLAGLIVVDFIDMEEKRNNRAVERRLKDSLRADRARIQVGRISHFGLLEMSRQRLRTGVLEGSTTPCDHCQGSGIIRSIESVSLAVLRGLEDTLVAGKMSSCVASCSAEVALYLLNQKRAFIQELEERYGVVIHVRSSSKQQGANFAIDPLQDVIAERPRAAVARDAVNIDTGFTSDRVADNDDEKDASSSDAKPRRRRRRRGRRDENRDNENGRDTTTEIEISDSEVAAANDDLQPDGDSDTAADTGEERPRRSRRRGRRGGRRHRDQRAAAADDVAAPGAQQPDLEAAADETDVAANSDLQANGTEAQEPPAIASETEAGQDIDQPEQPVEPAAEPDQQLEIDNPAANEVVAKTGNGTMPKPERSTAERMESLEPPTSSPPTEAVEAAPVHDEPVPAEPVAEEQIEPSEVTDTEPAEEDDVEQAADTVDRSARSQPVASEPVIQRVVVSPNGQQNGDHDDVDAAATVPTEADAKPSRRGWWQRQFGG